MWMMECVRLQDEQERRVAGRQIDDRSSHRGIGRALTLGTTTGLKLAAPQVEVVVLFFCLKPLSWTSSNLTCPAGFDMLKLT